MGDYQKKEYPKSRSNGSNSESKSNREFVNGIFVTKREGPYGEFFSLGLKKEEIIEQIQNLEEDDKGFVNLTMTPQKSNPNKYSVYVNAWKPGSNENSYQAPAKTQTTQPSSPKKSAPKDEDDTLPF
jgi:hypothetical protein